jgi:hypothetical protein
MVKRTGVKPPAQGKRKRSQGSTPSPTQPPTLRDWIAQAEKSESWCSLGRTATRHVLEGMLDGKDTPTIFLTASDSAREAFKERTHHPGNPWNQYRELLRPLIRLRSNGVLGIPKSMKIDFEIEYKRVVAMDREEPYIPVLSWAPRRGGRTYQVDVTWVPTPDNYHLLSPVAGSEDESEDDDDI